MPAGPSAKSAAPSRRELNKAATRQAITDAALALLRSNGPGNFTVEDIADAAGISRRTFFNYFGSTEAAIAAVTFGFLDKALQQFRLRPAGEPFLESARAALVELADPMTVAPMAELYSLGQAHPQLSRSELEAWDHCTAQIIAAARERFSGGTGVELDELYLRALAGSVISCGKAAMDVWFARCGGSLTPESLSSLRQLLIDSMSLLGSGFARPDTFQATPPAGQLHRHPFPQIGTDMALLLYRLGKFSYRHRWLVISLWLAAMLAVGGAAAAFHGTLSNNFQIPGTETQQMADKLKKELPTSSGGSASVVFEANGAQFSQAGKDAVSAALTELKTLPDVQGTVDPFATQAQLDKAAADLAAGKEQSAAGKAHAG